MWMIIATTVAAAYLQAVQNQQSPPSGLDPWEEMMRDSERRRMADEARVKRQAMMGVALLASLALAIANLIAGWI